MIQPHKSNKHRTILGTAILSALTTMPAIAEEDKVTAEKSNNDKKIEKILVIGKESGMLGTVDKTAGKMAVSLKDTGRSIVNIDQQQLEDLAIEDVRQAFDYVAGYRGNGTSDRSYIARGVSTSIDNVMVDGLRSLQGGEAGTGSRLPSVFNAESTTFLRGPAGLLYGAGVGGGLINIVTKQPSSKAQTTLGITNRNYVTEGSNFERSRTAFQLDSTGPISSENVLYRLIAQYTPDGEYFQEGRSIDETLLDAAMTFSIGENTKITPRLEYADRFRTGGSGYADGVFESNFSSGTITNYGTPINRNFYYGSSLDKGENESTSFSVLVEHEINEHWDASLRGRINDTESESIDLYISDSSGLNNTIGDDTVDRKWVSAKGDDSYSLFDGSIEGKFLTGDIEHHVLAGASYRDMQVKFARSFQANEDAIGINTISVANPLDQLVSPVPEELLNLEADPSDEQDTNIYLKDRIALGDFTLVAGLAYVGQDQSQDRSGETYTSSFSDVIWDIGTIYAVNNNINIFATFSRSYDPVSARYIAQYGQGKTDYKAVEGKNYELGIKGVLFNGHLNASATVFRLDRVNNTEFEYIDDAWHLLQLEGESFRSKGLEVDLGLSINGNWESSLSYAFVRAQDLIGDDAGIQSNNTPKHSVAIWNHYQLSGDWENVRLGLGLRYEGERLDNDYTIDSYFEADFGAYYETEKWDVSMTVRNLFDKNRVESGANWVTVQPNDPRSLTISGKYRF